MGRPIIGPSRPWGVGLLEISGERAADGLDQITPARTAQGQAAGGEDEAAGRNDVGARA